MRLKIAGHQWLDHRIDSMCCLPKAYGIEEPCCMSRATLFQAKPSDVGALGYAHSSTLTSGEYAEIDSARLDYDKYCDILMQALR